MRSHHVVQTELMRRQQPIHFVEPEPTDQDTHFSETILFSASLSQVCGFVQQPDRGEEFVERRPRYCPLLDIGTQFSICDDCMKGLWRWHCARNEWVSPVCSMALLNQKQPSAPSG